MFTASSYAGETRFLKGRVSYEVHPTPWQRHQVENMVNSAENLGFPDPGGLPTHALQWDWPAMVKEIGLPKTAIIALMKDYNLPGGHKDLSIGAPFPSTVLIFDRRPAAKVVWWDWKKKQKTVY